MQFVHTDHALPDNMLDFHARYSCN